eukprot:13043635-Ditylum_brightwellii.AAC.1
MGRRVIPAVIHAPAFMPCPQPLIAQLDNLNRKGGYTKGDPPKNWCCVKGSKAGALSPVFEGKGIGQYYT